MLKGQLDRSRIDKRTIIVLKSAQVNIIILYYKNRLLCMTTFFIFHRLGVSTVCDNNVNNHPFGRLTFLTPPRSRILVMEYYF